MSLTTRGRYAARIAVCLAVHGEGGRVTKREIADSEGISSDYIEQLMLRLKAAGLVRSHRGRHGGYSLAREAAGITLGEVLRAVEGPVSPVPCLDKGSCERAATCPTRPVWERAARALESLFEETSLARIAADSETRNSVASPAYTI